MNRIYTKKYKELIAMLQKDKKENLSIRDVDGDNYETEDEEHIYIDGEISLSRLRIVINELEQRQTAYESQKYSIEKLEEL